MLIVKVEFALVVVLERVTEDGLMEQLGGSVKLTGETLQVKLTVPEKLLAMTVSVLVPDWPAPKIVIEPGSGKTANVPEPPLTVIGALALEPV